MVVPVLLVAVVKTGWERALDVELVDCGSLLVRVEVDDGAVHVWEVAGELDEVVRVVDVLHPDTVTVTVTVADGMILQAQVDGSGMAVAAMLIISRSLAPSW